MSAIWRRSCLVGIRNDLPPTSPGRRASLGRPAVAVWALAILLLLAGMPPGLAGQGWVEPIRPVPGAWIQRVNSGVRVEVEGNVARVVVDEWFEAHGRGLGEASAAAWTVMC